MIRYFLKALAARVRSGRSLYLLTLCGVALGVASVLSIQIINRNALSAFEGSLAAVSGDADLTVFGVGPTLDETLLPDVLAQHGVAAASPLYRLDVALGGAEEVYLEVLGLDFFSPRPVPWDVLPAARADPLELEGWVAISPRLGRQYGLAQGSRFEVTSGSRRVVLQVGALVDFKQLTPLAGDRMVVMDIAQAQSLFGGAGRLHQIDVTLRGGFDAGTVRDSLQAGLGSAARVVTPRQRRDEAEGLIGAFRLNLTALSLIALFVGGFLVYASTQAALVRRREEFGVLRSCGATRGQVLALILVEVGLLGLLGVLLGLPLGYFAAQANVEMVSRTLSNLYLLERIETLVLPPWLFALGAAIGIGAALGGALFPALDASRRDSRALLSAQTLHERIDRVSSPLALAGLALILLGALIYALGARQYRPGGFVVGVGLLSGLPLLAPWLMRAVTRRLRPRSFGLLYGIQALGLRLQTSAIAVAALAVAVSMLVGITLMIGSFRRTVEIWLVASAHADVYVSSESWRRAREDATLDAALVRALAAQPGVRRADRLRQLFVYSGERRIGLGAIDFGPGFEQDRFSMLHGDLARESPRLHRDGAVLISEPLSRKARLGVGDSLPISGPRGEVLLPIVGVFYDYSSESGSAAIDLVTLERIFGPGEVNNVALYLAPGVEVERFIDGLKRRFAGAPLIFRSNRDLRDEVRRIFDQTFAVTRLLQGMSLLIAVSGITLTLIVLARERVAELALYRALGAERLQVFRVFMGQGLGIAGFGLGIGAVGGVALAAVLIFLINRAYFGWTIAIHWPWAALARQVLTIVVAAVLAAVYPALRASRVPATELTREEL